MIHGYRNTEHMGKRDTRIENAVDTCLKEIQITWLSKQNKAESR